MPESPVDLDWLVEERSRIQRLSLRLLALMNAKKEAILAQEASSDAALLLVGATFSLWRAIFLAHINKEKIRNFDHAQEFLHKVVRHNIINYPDDVKFQMWSFGYYLNNCRFRLQQICPLIELPPPAWLSDTLPVESESQDEWCRHCDLVEEAIASLETRFAR